MGFWKLDTNKKRDMNHYYKFIPKTFYKLRDSNIIFFYEQDEILEYIKSICKTNNFIPIKLPVIELPTYPITEFYLESCKNQSKKYLKAKWEKGSMHYRREYIICGEDNYRKIISIWTSKLLLIKRSIELNPFNSDIFAWADMSITKRPIAINYLKYNMNKIITNISPGCVKFKGKSLANAAGFMISSKDTWLKVIPLYEAKLEEMKNSNYAHDEETIISLVRQENKGLFSNKIKLII